MTNRYKPNVLLLGGGGMKGLLELGALGVLETEGILDSVKTFIGVSVGAIIALLKVVGYTAVDIATMAVQTSILPSFEDVDISKILEMRGLISSEHLKEQLNQQVRKRWGFIPNLKELYLLTGFKLIVVTFDLRSAVSKHVSYLTDPELDCVKAALMSANIPGLFYNILYGDMVCVDGGFYDPLPIAQYDDGTNEILAVTILSDVRPDFHKSTFEYLYRVIQCVMITLTNKAKASMTSKCSHLELHTPCTDTVGMNITAKDKAVMLVSGTQQCRAFLTRQQEKHQQNTP